MKKKVKGSSKRKLVETHAENVVDEDHNFDSEADVTFVADVSDDNFSSESNMEGTFSCVKPLHEAHHEATFFQGSSEINPLDNPADDMCIKDPVIIEIFCGSSRVTACLKAIGLTSSFGVDHAKVKAASTCKIADLSCASGQALMMSWLRSPNVRGIFLAPPCGTYSLARCIQLRDPKGRGIPGLVPLSH